MLFYNDSLYYIVLFESERIGLFNFQILVIITLLVPIQFSRGNTTMNILVSCNTSVIYIYIGLYDVIQSSACTIGLRVSYNIGALHIIAIDPPKHTRPNIHRKSRSITSATYFQSSWVCNNNSNKRSRSCQTLFETVNVNTTLIRRSLGVQCKVVVERYTSKLTCEHTPFWFIRHIAAYYRHTYIWWLSTCYSHQLPSSTTNTFLSSISQQFRR